MAEPAIDAKYSKYLPVEAHARDWGLYVIDCGFTEIPPEMDYPPGKHPEGYMFTWESGRILTEHQLVLISRGSGYFESRRCGLCEVSAGDLIVVHQGAWHRYRPSRETGWVESWVGFGGEYADHLMEHFFPRDDPVLHTRPDDPFLELFRGLAEDMRRAQTGFAPLMVARTIEILARLHPYTVSSAENSKPRQTNIQRARLALLARYDEEVDLPALARELGMSYSTFRRTFKAATGSSPRHYQLQIRLNRSKALLAGTALPVAHIAERTGFSSVYYFSRYFKQCEGLSPTVFRKRLRTDG